MKLIQLGLNVLQICFLFFFNKDIWIVMRHISVLGTIQLVKIMQGFTMAGQMDTDTVRLLVTGIKLKALAALDIANWMLLIFRTN